MSVSRSFIRQIKKIVGGQEVQTDLEDLIAYGVDASSEEVGSPDMVVHPGSHEEVTLIVQAAATARVPLVPRGAGTGLSGGSLNPQGGLLLVFDRMDRLVRLDAQDMTAVVEPGIRNWDLRQAALAEGLFYPPDPSSTRVCTIGGNVAENASGPRGIKYGSTSDYLLGVKGVLSSGKSLSLGSSARRDVTGYDLLHLVAGSEGTLMILTEITLRLLPRPPHRRAALYSFPSAVAAGGAVVAMGSSGVDPSAIEFMDQTALECTRQAGAAHFPTEDEAQLLIEVDGGNEQVAAQMQELKSICESAAGILLREAESESEVNELWEARRSVSASLGRGGRRKIGEDISIPVSKIPEMISRIEKIASQHELIIAVFGHAGVGNLHPNILVDDRDANEFERANLAISDLFRAAIELGGTLSGEHGIGTAKAPFLEMALDREQIELMKGIKQVFDPEGILNPGKIFAAPKKFGEFRRPPK